MSYSGFKTKVKGFGKSLSNWEDSFFGGYNKVLWDHPDLNASYDLEFKNDKSDALGYYRFGKLIKLFLKNTSDRGYQDTLVDDMIVEKLQVWGRNITRYTIRQEAIGGALKRLITSNIELANMFDHFKDLISGTRIYYDIPESEQKNKPDIGEGDGESPKDDKTKDGKDPKEGEQKKKAEETMHKMISEITERKPFGGTGMYSGDGQFNATFDVMRVSDPCTYSSEEELYAGQLVNLLDISFDPKVDRVGSLKSGKLDAARICEIPSGNFNVYYRLEENISTKPFSVCVLGDESGSMGSGYGSQLWYMQSMLKILYRAFSEILPQDRMFFYGHSGDDAPIISVYHDKYNPNFETTIGKVGLHRSQNYDGAVIQAVYDKVREQTSDNIIFIVVSDGLPCGHNYGGEKAVSEIKRLIEKCKRDGFATLGIGVRFDYVRYIYPHFTVVNNMKKEFVSKVSHLINHVVKTEFQD